MLRGANLIKFLSYIYAYLRENSNFIQSIEGAKESAISKKFRETKC